MAIETILSFVGLGLSAQSVVGGVVLGKKTDSVLKRLNDLEINITRLSDGLIYADTAPLVRESNRIDQRLVTDAHQIKDVLEPLHRQLGEPIIATSHIQLPSLSSSMLNKNPWDVMFDISPLDKIKSSKEPDSVPILFFHEESFYIGWQKIGILPSLFGCEFRRDDLYKPSTNIVQLKTQVSPYSVSSARHTPTKTSDLSEIWERTRHAWRRGELSALSPDFQKEAMRDIPMSEFADNSEKIVKALIALNFRKNEIIYGYCDDDFVLTNQRLLIGNAQSSTYDIYELLDIATCTDKGWWTKSVTVVLRNGSSFSYSGLGGCVKQEYLLYAISKAQQIHESNS